MTAAFELAVQDAYRPPNTALEPAMVVAGMRAYFGSDGVDRIPQAEGERLIRAALDDRIRIDDIPGQVAFTVRGLVFAGIAFDLRYSEKEVDTLLRRAERIAIKRGFRPTPDAAE